MGRMVRTNIVLDEDLVTEVMGLYGLESRREAVDFALRKTLGREERFADPWKAALELEGIWADMTDAEAREIWGDEVPDGPAAPGGSMAALRAGLRKLADPPREDRVDDEDVGGRGRLVGLELVAQRKRPALRRRFGCSVRGVGAGGRLGLR